MLRFLTQLLAMLILATVISGCAKEKVFLNDPKAEYEAAKKLVNAGSYNMAANNLDHFSSNYPYSKYAIPAELLRIFAAYKGHEFVLSETLSDTFVTRHPRHADVDYALYMLAMSHYQQKGNAQKDPTHVTAAIDAFKRLVKDYPQSSYAAAGKRYLQTLYNSLAEHELNVGKFYFDNERYAAAANRFQYIIKKYQTTSSIEEALYLLASSYHKMEMNEDARQTAILLQHNYPNSNWSHKAGSFL